MSLRCQDCGNTERFCRNANVNESSDVKIYYDSEENEVGERDYGSIKDSEISDYSEYCCERCDSTNINTDYQEITTKKDYPKEKLDDLKILLEKKND